MVQDSLNLFYESRRHTNTKSRRKVLSLQTYDPVLGENSHLYEIVGLGDDTETGKILVIYKPLYESKYLIEKGAEYFIRPLSEFFDFVDRDEYQGPRFIKI